MGVNRHRSRAQDIEIHRLCSGKCIISLLDRRVSVNKNTSENTIKLWAENAKQMPLKPAVKPARTLKLQTALLQPTTQLWLQQCKRISRPLWVNHLLRLLKLLQQS